MNASAQRGLARVYFGSSTPLETIARGLKHYGGPGYVILVWIDDRFADASV